MSIGLIREKILEYTYPTKTQLDTWKKEHHFKRNDVLGVKNLKCFNISICPLCMLFKYSSLYEYKNHDNKRKKDFYTLKNKFKNHFGKILDKYPQECYDCLQPQLSCAMH